jgi:IS5 family transposase
MKQQTLAVAADENARFEQYRPPTKRDVFLATMEQIGPWTALCGVIEPHCPKAGNGRPPVGLERMLWMYFVQHWFNLADAASESALLDSTTLRRFVGIDLGWERVPDATALLKFRRLLEKHKLGEAMFAKVGETLQAQGLKVGTGTIVDATLIGAPSSTKYADKQRDPEMHQTRKGKRCFFGIRRLRVRLAGQADPSQGPWSAGPDQQDRGFRQPTEELERMVNRGKLRVRLRVEQVFGMVKRLWGYGKVRHRGQAKNAARAFVATALANIFLARRSLQA